MVYKIFLKSKSNDPLVLTNIGFHYEFPTLQCLTEETGSARANIRQNWFRGSHTVAAVIINIHEELKYQTQLCAGPETNATFRFIFEKHSKPYSSEHKSSSSRNVFPYPGSSSHSVRFDDA